jgi:uncharacterized membrane-anchored protein YhcB (DUF1043 family)
MEITSFILGVCAVIVIAMVVGTFVNYMSVKQLKEHLDTLDRDIHRQLEQVDEARGKQHFEHIDYVDTLHNKHENDLNELYRYVDSRTDKLEAKFSSNIASGVEVKKALDEVKDLNERLDRFIRNYQNI